MARHQRMPAFEAEYTCAVDVKDQKTVCLQMRRSPYTVIDITMNYLQALSRQLITRTRSLMPSYVFITYYPYFFR